MKITKKLTPEEREKALQMVWSWCDMYEDSIRCYDAILNECGVAYREGNIHFKLDDMDYIPEDDDKDWPGKFAKAIGESAVVNSTIAHIQEMIRDMLILISKRNRIKNIVFRHSTIKQINSLIRDFFKTKKSYEPKWQRYEKGIPQLMEFLSS